MNLLVEEVKNVMKTQELEANILLEVMDLQNLNHMIKIGENLKLSLMDDYDKLQSLSIKQILLEDCQKINKNIRAIRHAIKFYGFGFSLN